MNNDVLLLTTPTAEGLPVENYYGIVTANQVAGTGFLTDLTASFSDLFGGHSGAYRESMNKLYTDVTERLKAKAAEMGANAVLGTRIDYDSISAKSMSMFMVSIQGTAVRLSIPANETQTPSKDEEVTWEFLTAECVKKRILRKLEQEEGLTEEEWNYILRNPHQELNEPLYQYYVRCRDLIDGNAYGPTYAYDCTKRYPSYLISLDYDEAVEYAYKDAKSFRDVLEKKRLFNAKRILKILDAGDLDTAVSLLDVPKYAYGENDLTDMRDLLARLRTLPEIGRRVETQGGLFSSAVTKYECSCGHKNDISVEYCEKCGKNIHGLTEEQESKIDSFEELVETLSCLLKSVPR